MVISKTTNLVTVAQVIMRHHVVVPSLIVIPKIALQTRVRIKRGNAFSACKP